MLQQPLVKRYSFHQYNEGGPGCCCSQPVKEAVDVPILMSSDRDP